MALADLLGLSGAIAAPDLTTPAPVNLGQVPAQTVPVNITMPQANLAPPQQGPSKLRNFLGAIGDALLVAHGQQPLYRQRMEQQRQQQALQGFLTNPDQAIAQLMQIPGQAANAIDLYKAVHPASETPLEIKLLKHLKEHPEDAAMLHQIDAELHPGMMTPVTIGQNDIYDPTGASVTTGDVTATGPNGEKIRLNRQTGQWEPVGGQTATPSGGFR